MSIELPDFSVDLHEAARRSESESGRRLHRYWLRRPRAQEAH